jgi:acyl-CoA synthetase (AMP-forming)/AMP-acid ligase II
VNWMSTGDQAVMYTDGNTKIFGRYKDMIIRGGENLSHSAIELLLSNRFGMTAEIIGIPDEFQAGGFVGWQSWPESSSWTCGGSKSSFIHILEFLNRCG